MVPAATRTRGYCRLPLATSAKQSVYSRPGGALIGGAAGEARRTGVPAYSILFTAGNWGRGAAFAPGWPAARDRRELPGVTTAPLANRYAFP